MVKKIRTVPVPPAKKSKSSTHPIPPTPEPQRGLIVELRRRSATMQQQAEVATRERDEAVSMLLTLQEECVNAGLERGDRTVLLANVRRLIQTHTTTAALIKIVLAIENAGGQVIGEKSRIIQHAIQIAKGLK